MHPKNKQNITIRDEFPIENYGASIYGDWESNIQSFEQAEKILHMADMARDGGEKLSAADQEIEYQAFVILRRKMKS